MTQLNEALKANARPADAMLITLPHGPKVDMLTLDLEAIHRLAQYGARQWVQDAIAGTAKELKEEGRSDDEIKQVLTADQEERWQAILDGTVGTRAGGPRMRGIDKVIRDVAIEEIKAAMAKLQKKLPKGDAWQDMVGKYVAKHGDRLKTEAERRMATQAVDESAAKELAAELGITL